MKILQIILLLLITNNLKAQLDTTDWYPLHIGDKWEYYGSGFGYSQVEVIGDTLMPNEHTYYIFSDGVYAWRFQRKHNEKVYYYSTAENKEYLLFDFNTKDKVLWEVDFDFFWGILETSKDNKNLLNVQLPYKIFERARIDTAIDPPDTTWGYLIDAYPSRITKGLGVTSYTYDLTYLVGAEINGIGYGTLVDIDEQINIVNDFELHQNYPNPFNPSTKIKYSISGLETNGNTSVQLRVYNVLGREVRTLVNNHQQKPGDYIVTFDASSLPSGTYLIQLVSGNYKHTIKAQLLK